MSRYKIKCIRVIAKCRSKVCYNAPKTHVKTDGEENIDNFTLSNFVNLVLHLLQVSGEYGLLLLLTKYGYLYLCEMETSSCLCCTRVSLDIIFTSTLNTATQGIIGVTRSGQVSIYSHLYLNTQYSNTGYY